MSDALPILSCDDCGACCTTMGHPRFFWTQQQGSIVEQHWIDLPQPLVNEIEAYLNALGGDANADFGRACIWFDPEKKNCRHHEYRPQLCRDFEIGGEACLRVRRQNGIG